MKDKIIRLAKEAGMEQDGDNFFSPGHEEIDVHITDLERFYNLAIQHEREECANVCEELIAHTEKNTDGFFAAVACVLAIRARGEKK